MDLIQPEATLIFLRHGQQEPTGTFVPHTSGLTEIGRNEMRQVGRKLALDPETSTGYSVNNARSLASLALALYPNTEDGAISSKVQELLTTGRIITRTDLSYMPIADQLFQDQLSQAFANSQALRFLVDYSDIYRLASGSAMSSYSTLAYTAARTIRWYYEKSQNKQGGNSEVLNGLFCGREFIQAAFRAKLLENTEGVNAREEYVNWYGETIEWSDAARSSLGKVTISHADSSDALINVSDSYGETKASLLDIERIIKDFELKYLNQRTERNIV